MATGLDLQQFDSSEYGVPVVSKRAVTVGYPIATGRPR
jgi:hypothetical protein